MVGLEKVWSWGQLLSFFYENTLQIDTNMFLLTESKRAEKDYKHTSKKLFWFKIIFQNMILNI
jgi:nucleoside diphosphate kinase